MSLGDAAEPCPPLTFASPTRLGSCRLLRRGFADALVKHLDRIEDARNDVQIVGRNRPAAVQQQPAEEGVGWVFEL